jgi:hypothetical protein
VLVLPWEDSTEYGTLIAALVAQHSPRGPTEEHLVADPLVCDHAFYRGLGGSSWERRAAYRALFESPADPAFLHGLRAATNGGWALGDERFKRHLAAAGEPRRCREAGAVNLAMNPGQIYSDPNFPSAQLAALQCNQRLSKLPT